ATDAGRRRGGENRPRDLQAALATAGAKHTRQQVRSVATSGDANGARTALKGVFRAVGIIHRRALAASMRLTAEPTAARSQASDSGSQPGGTSQSSTAPSNSIGATALLAFRRCRKRKWRSRGASSGRSGGGSSGWFDLGRTRTASPIGI